MPYVSQFYTNNLEISAQKRACSVVDNSLMAYKNVAIMYTNRTKNMSCELRCVMIILTWNWRSKRGRNERKLQRDFLKNIFLPFLLVHARIARYYNDFPKSYWSKKRIHLNPISKHAPDKCSGWQQTIITCLVSCATTFSFKITYCARSQFYRQTFISVWQE
jgi:hypothetical protein